MENGAVEMFREQVSRNNVKLANCNRFRWVWNCIPILIETNTAKCKHHTFIRVYTRAINENS